MDYFGLKCFVEVARLGSFSRAADKLFRTQPAVSLQVRKLEKELKLPLLERYGRKVRLTDTGKILYAQAKELSEKMEDIKRLVSHSVSQPEGELTIATNLSLINNFLPGYVGNFLTRYPKVRFKFLNVTSKGIEKAILEGKAEIGIGFLAEPNSSVRTIKIAESDFIMVVKPKAVSDQLIHFEPGVELREYTEKILTARHPFKVGMELPSIESILNYVRLGLGYSVLPDLAVPDHWRKDLAIKKAANIPPLTIAAYIHKRRVLSKAGEKFLELLEKHRNKRLARLSQLSKGSTQ